MCREEQIRDDSRVPRSRHTQQPSQKVPKKAAALKQTKLRGSDLVPPGTVTQPKHAHSTAGSHLNPNHQCGEAASYSP